MQRFGNYLSIFNEVWNESKPLAKLFRTAEKAYIYDTGTNKIMNCDEYVFELLDRLYSSGAEAALRSFYEKHGEEILLHAAESIKNAMESQNILKFKKAEEFRLTGDKLPSLNMFMQRPLFNEPEKSINLNGCCVPGARRLYVTVDGNFKVCERIDPTAVSVGNVFSGLDVEAVKKSSQSIGFRYGTHQGWC